VGSLKHVAVRSAAEDAALSAEGADQKSDVSTGTLFTPSSLQIGAAFNGGAIGNGAYHSISYAPEAWTNAELEAFARN